MTEWMRIIAAIVFGALASLAVTAGAHDGQIHEDGISGCVGVTFAEDHERIRRLERLVLVEHGVTLVASPSDENGRAVARPLKRWQITMRSLLRTSVASQNHIEGNCGIAAMDCERLPCREIEGWSL